MMRFLGNCLFLIYLAWMLLMLLMQGIGKTAPEISKIAFFKERTDGTGTDYWRLDVLSGIAFPDSYQSRLFLPQSGLATLEHVLSVTGDANYFYVSEVNLYTREASYVTWYPSRGYNILLAGDYIFTYDLASVWRRVEIATGDLDYFGRVLNMRDMRVSPDGQWLAGRIYTNNWQVLSILGETSYEIEPYAFMTWSPNSRWILVGNYQTASVLNTDDGSVVMSEIPARLATWSSDGESLLIENQAQLSILSIPTGETVYYPDQFSFYWLQCLSPDKRHILSHDDRHAFLLNLETQTSQSLFPLPASTTINCFWSEDSRYLLFYRHSTANERFYFLDTQNNNRLDLYPQHLPSEAFYLHIPD
jgi:hypothetical protein